MSDQSEPLSPEFSSEHEQNICDGCPAASGAIPEEEPNCRYYERQVDFVDGESMRVDTVVCSNPSFTDETNLAIGAMATSQVELP